MIPADAARETTDVQRLREEIERVSRAVLSTIQREYAWERDRKIEQDDAIIAARDAFVGIGAGTVWDVILALCATLEERERTLTAVRAWFDAWADCQRLMLRDEAVRLPEWDAMIDALGYDRDERRALTIRKEQSHVPSR